MRNVSTIRGQIVWKYNIDIPCSKLRVGDYVNIPHFHRKGRITELISKSGYVCRYPSSFYVVIGTEMTDVFHPSYVVGCRECPYRHN